MKLLALVLLTASAFAQTVDQRIKQLESRSVEIIDTENLAWSLGMRMAQVEAKLESNQLWMKTVVGGIMAIILKDVAIAALKKRSNA